MTTQIYWSVLSIGLLSLSAVSSPLADEVEDEIDDVNAVKCINVRSLRRTEVVDDRTIIFSMAGSKTYLNILPRECHGLEREDRFTYKISGGSLCDLDMLRILYQAGAGLQEGNACRLGLFHPISKEDAEAIMEGSDEPLQANPVPLPEPEEIGADSEESANEQQTL